MPGTLTRPDFFEHVLDVVKGPGKQHRLDFDAPPKAGEPIFEGSVCSIDSNGELIAGVIADADNNAPMPMFAIQSLNDFDANSEVGNISGGVMSAIVASGGYEISTTEFVSGTYNPNDTLTPDLNGASDQGKVEVSAVTYSDTVICGIVSRGEETGTDGQANLFFWTVFIPAIRASGLV